MLRTMRSNAKYVFFILAGSFVLWLAIGQVMQILHPSANIVPRVNGPEVTRDPQFQSNGQFDIRKWQQFLQSGADRNTLAQIEALYRDRIPQIKLAQYITADVFVSDAKLWRIYKDQHDSATVAVLPIWPYLITDSIPVTDAELQRYLKE